MSKQNVLIIGAGPAGLTAGYKIAKSQKFKPIILESDDKYVGGISRTVDYKGYKFDIGGHRFFSKSKEIEDLWTEILGDELLVRPRLSRIFYGGKFYDYPLKPLNALKNLGLINSLLILISYAKARLFPIKNPKTFQEWVTNQFGYRLFSIFFKTYTEKVWGMKCNEISADWAAQRIKGLSLINAITSSLKKNGKDGEVIKTLIDKFRYPRLGPGQMWETAQKKIAEMGGEIILGEKVIEIEVDNNKATSVTTLKSDGTKSKYYGENVISTMPIKHLLKAITPSASIEAIDSANKLKYRDFITVALIIDEKDVFPDNWIYIHDENVKLGRVQNFKNWSEDMVPDVKTTCLGLEYFCFEGDDLWNLSDQELIELGKKEISKIGLVQKDKIKDGTVVRMKKAYPVYDDDYKNLVANVKEFTDKIENLYLVGRNGMHKYNNQDHSMMAAIIAVRKILGEKDLDPWKVNTDAEYHEEFKDDEGRAVPKHI